MIEPLTDRQLRALSYRAKRRGDVSTDLERGVADTTSWLRAQFAQHDGDLAALKAALRGRLYVGFPWDVSSYDDGVAAVLDDVAAILDNDPDSIRDIIDQGRATARSTKEA